MIRIGVCDDESACRQEIIEPIKSICRRQDVMCQIKEYESAEEVLEETEFNADVLFLDIYLGNMNGIELAKKIREENEEVIIVFVTSAIEFAKEGYKVKAFRYIIKPINDMELEEEFQSCLKEWKKHESNILTLKNNQGVYRLKTRDILYIETYDKGVIIHTNQGDFPANVSLNTLEEKLREDSFARVHRSYIVNIQYITALEKDIAIINDDERILVSRYKLKELKEKVLQYVEGVV